MNELPAEFFLSIFLVVDLVVSGNIAVKSSQENHGDHSREEENDYEGVHDREPLDVGMREGIQEIIPSRTPLYRCILPIHRVSVDYSALLIVSSNGLRAGGIAAVRLFGVFVLDASWQNLDLNNSSSDVMVEHVRFVRHVSVLYKDVHMVEEIIGIGGVIFVAQNTGVLRSSIWGHIAAHGETGETDVVTLLVCEAEGYWHVVHDPMMLIVELHSTLQKSNSTLVFGIARLVFFIAKNSTHFFFFEVNLKDGIYKSEVSEFPEDHVHKKSYLVRRRPNSLSEQHLTEVLHRGIIFADGTEVEAVIFVRDDTLVTVKFIYIEWDFILKCSHEKQSIDMKKLINFI